MLESSILPASNEIKTDIQTSNDKGNKKENLLEWKLSLLFMKIKSDVSMGKEKSTISCLSGVIVISPIKISNLFEARSLTWKYWIYTYEIIQSNIFQPRSL